jgi:hypothetical protein
MVLWNPTNEDFDMQYAGISITMKSGERDAFAMKCATHLLNAYGQRGLTSLIYGCDEDKVGMDAIRRNIDFKTKQVVEYNQRNESRKAMQLGYLPPTEHIKKYAIELGLKLLEPYAIREEERSAISAVSLENEGLKNQLASQSAEMSELRDMMQQLLAQNKQDSKQTNK